MEVTYRLCFIIASVNVAITSKQQKINVSILVMKSESEPINARNYCRITGMNAGCALFHLVGFLSGVKGFTGDMSS